MKDKDEDKCRTGQFSYSGIIYCYSKEENMELYQLKELAALGKYGSISKAAEAVGVSQPAMSRSMKLLEEELGVPIFQRTSNTITLNDTGMVAVSLAGELTSKLDSAIEEIRDYDRRKKIILVGSEAPAPLWSVVSMLSDIEREKTIAGEMKSRKILEDGLRSGTYRYIITTEPIKAGGLSTMRLGEENLMFVLPLNHRYAGSKTLSFKDLDGENMLLYENIGFWRGLPEKKMPSTKFIVQSDREAFEELVMKSTIPSFGTDLLHIPLEGKVSVPISDEEAHVTFYISARTGEMQRLSYLTRHFTTEFRRNRRFSF